MEARTTADSRHRHERGSAAPMLMLLLAILVGGGGYNYWRNFQAEQAVPRPYVGYSDANLAQLITAYEEEAELEQARIGQPTRSKATQRVGGGLIMDHVNDFERAASARRAYNEEAGKLAGTEAVLRDLRAEQDLRAQTGAGLQVHLNRLLKI